MFRIRNDKTGCSGLSGMRKEKVSQIICCTMCKFCMMNWVVELFLAMVNTSIHKSGVLKFKSLV